MTEPPICMDCQQPITTTDDYYELELRAVDDPTVTMTALCHAGCRVMLRVDTPPK